MAGPQSMPEPKVVRMPNRTDPSIRDARNRAIKDAKGKGGRSSTILSQALQAVNGAGGKLGA